ncbi:hypothetical protein [Cellvibrio sp. pealriver]|uniref:hypothetical protein n=1 Tax=Cellvibrio sp. pealriver TaxID=1622269 RepID=UPI00066FF132|nr:hypothetical protein [Cellvibrio sp. pealriver]
MHKFTLMDSHILLGIFYADKGADIVCTELIASCAAINPEIPSLEAFAAAFNKLLYTSIIHLDGDKIYFTDFGRELIHQANTNAGIHPNEPVQLVLKVLSGFKLKSMCNRNVWSQEQYQQAVNAQRSNAN